MKKLCSGPERIKHWLDGSIRRKLTVFVLLVCLMLIVLVWLLGVQMLEPAYIATIRKELTHTVSTIAATFDKAERQNVPIVTTLYEDDTVVYYTLSQEMRDLLNERIEDGELQIENLCIDVSDSSGRPLLIRDRLPSNCNLHNTGWLLEDRPSKEPELLTRMRQEIFATGQAYTEIPEQIVMGKLAADKQIAVLVSTNLERIPQAVGVLRQQMLYVSVALVLISLLCAFVFSRWFAKPLTRLSDATKQMAKGNYDVSVPAVGCDEIAALTRDFNSMAQEVKQSADMQRDLIANVSHDLRTPLTLIKGYAETIRDLSGDDPGKRSEQLTVIMDEVDRLSALVGSVMELTRVSSGHEKPQPVVFDLAQLCDEMTYRFDALARQQGYSFEFKGDEPCDVKADPALMQRAIQNLLGNALNHVGEDGYIGLHIYKTANHTARVEVSDHGPGIAPQDQPHLFERYYRSRADAGKPGTGLGLSITKAIFDAHGFNYGVQSELGKGAMFWFEVPLEQKSFKTHP